MIGSVVGGKYRVERRIGAGGMGTVYEAVHTQTGRAVALKVLKLTRSSSGSDPGSHDTMRAYETEMAERFKREALATGRIASEHVVEVLDADTDAASASPFIVMELLAGETVHDVAKRVRRLRPQAALAIAAQACEGLRAAHEAGIVHRDVKTANLLLADRPDGRRVVKVLDFGIAKVEMERFSEEAATGLTLTGSVLGSPQFMSPEQARGLKTIDHRADLWSLGVVLYRLLAGELPFGGGALAQILLDICTAEPEPVRARAPWVSESTSQIVSRALRKDPEARWSSAAELLAALQRELAALGSDGSVIRDAMLVPPTEREMSELAPLLSESTGAIEREGRGEADGGSLPATVEPPRPPLGEAPPARRAPGHRVWFAGAAILGGGLALALVLVLSNRVAATPPSELGRPSGAATVEAASATSPAPVEIRASPTGSVAPGALGSAIEPAPSSAALAANPPPRPSLAGVRAPPATAPVASAAAPAGSSKPAGHVGGTTAFE
ncbi:MAG: serine/threonine-protein kinase [Polyangiaceae bacterium]